MDFDIAAMIICTLSLVFIWHQPQRKRILVKYRSEATGATQCG